MSEYLKLRSIAIVIAIFIGSLFLGTITYTPPISYHGFEKMEIVGDGYIRITDEPSGWIIKLWLKNSGIISAKITSAYLDDVPIPDSNYGSSEIIQGEIHTSIPDIKNGLKCECGQTEVISIYVSDQNYSEGSRINMNIRLHSANGNDYIKNMYMYKSPRTILID